MSASVVSALIKFGETLNDHNADEKSKLRVLNTLTEVNLTLHELSESGVGRAVRKLKSEPGALGRTAQTLIMKWKNLLNSYVSQQPVSFSLPATNNLKSIDDRDFISSSVPKTPQVSHTKLNDLEQNINLSSTSTKKDASCSIQHSPTKNNHDYKNSTIISEKKEFSKKPKAQTVVDSVDSSSGLSFMESLNMGSSVRKNRNRKKQTKTLIPNSNEVPVRPSTSFTAEVLSSLNEPVVRPDVLAVNKTTTHSDETPDDEAFENGELKFKSKKILWVPKQNRTAVNQLLKDENKYPHEVPSLINLCVDVLEQHVQHIDQLGCVPYELIARALRSASADDLTRIERFNPQFVGLSDELWRKHVQRDFQHVNNVHPKSNETWCEFYHRLAKEEAARLDRVIQSARRVKEVQEISGRRTALTIEAITPRQMRKRGARQSMYNHVNKKFVQEHSGSMLKPRNMSYPIANSVSQPTLSSATNKSVPNSGGNRGNLLNKLRKQFRSGQLR